MSIENNNEVLDVLQQKYRKLERRNRMHSFLFLSLLVLFLCVSFYKPSDKIITVERLNIVEPNGKLRMVLTNKAMSPGNLEYGKEFIKGGLRSGMIFYNDEETECGGLVYDGITDSNSKEYSANGHLSFDQYNQNQVVYLSYYDENGKRQMGLSVDEWQTKPSFKEWRDQIGRIYEQTSDTALQRSLYQKLLYPAPERRAYSRRVFLGRDEDANAALVLFDQLNRVRLEIKVDSLGTAAIVFFDEKGRVVKTIGEL